MLAAALLSCALAGAAATAAAGPTASKLFGYAVKNGALPPFPTEWTTFEHTCSAPPCVVTQLHVASIAPADGCPWDWEHGRIMIWLDDPVVPTVNITLLQLAAIGHKGEVGINPPEDGSPFGSDLFGRLSLHGGVYSTVRFPFQSTLRIALRAPPSCNVTDDSQTAWMLVRGYENYRVVLGTELVLPPDAKLVVETHVNTTVDVLDYLTVASAPPGTAGALLLTQMDGDSTSPVYLEACWRYYPNGATTPLFLSSGSEDYFLSAYYFSEMLYHTSQSGLTYDDHVSCVSAYKVHDRDLVLFNDGFQLALRNWENDDCPTAWVPQGEQRRGAASSSLTHRRGADGNLHYLGDPAPVNYSTTAWYYVWPNTSKSSWVWEATAPAPAALPTAAVGALLDMVAAGLLAPAVEQAALAALDEDSATGRAVSRLLSGVRGEKDLSTAAGVLTRLLEGRRAVPAAVA